jgi:hypothetical protein
MGKKTQKMNKPKPTKPWKDELGTQVTEDSLWELTKDYTSYLNHNHGLTISTDPLNLSGLNDKRDSGIAAPHALGISTEVKERNVKQKKQKKKAPVVRVCLNIKTKKQIPKKKLVELKELPTNNNAVYSSRRNITIRAVVKALKRDFGNYRRDLVPVALKRLNNYRVYKNNNKWNNRKEAKKNI